MRTFGYLRVKNVSRFWMRRESVPQRGLMMDTPGTSSSGSTAATRRCSRHFLERPMDLHRTIFFIWFCHNRCQGNIMCLFVKTSFWTNVWWCQKILSILQKRKCSELNVNQIEGGEWFITSSCRQKNKKNLILDWVACVFIRGESLSLVHPC